MFKSQYSKVGAWFLGPKAENEETYLNFVKTALEEHSKWRRAYCPEDPRSITADDQLTDAHNEQLQIIRRELQNLTKRLRNSAPFFSSRYKGHMNWDTSMIGSLGYFVTSLWNPNNVAIEGSPVTNFIEIEVGRQLCRMLRYPENKNVTSSWGHITSCGSVANIESLWAARSLRYLPYALKEALIHEPRLADFKTIQVILADGTQKLFLKLNEWELLNIPADNILSVNATIIDSVGPDAQNLVEEYAVATVGMGQVKQGCYIVSATRHYSWDKAGALLGIGKKNMRLVEVDVYGRMDMNALETILQECLDDKVPVLSVVAIVGTTAEGAIDPVKQILDMRDNFRHKGLDFYVHADAAWGGYLCSMLPPKTRSITFVPYLPLNDAVQEQLESLARCDSITLDPHKSGYIQYPAGALCYRNGSTRFLLNYTAQYLYSGTGDQSVGLFGIEGSKPGAAVAATYLHNTVVRLDQSGHGLLLGEANFTTKMMYCVINTLSNNNDPFRVASYQKLPEGVTRAHLEEILKLSNEDINKDKKYKDILKAVGPDVLINGFAVNFKWPLMSVDFFQADWNTSNEVANDVVSNMAIDLNFGSKDPSDDVTSPQGVARKKLFMIRNTLHPKYQREVAEDLRARVHLPPSPNEPLKFMVATNMDPWPTATGFLNVFRHELRQSIFRSVGARKENPHLHGFVAVDAGTYTDSVTGKTYYEVFGDHLPMFSMPEHQYHVIIKVAFDTLEEKQKYFNLATEPNQPIIFGNSEAITLAELLHSPNPVMMDIFLGMPSETNKPLGQARLRITDIVRYEHFEPNADYPKEAEYFIFGNKQSGAYLSHCPAKYPDYHNVVRLDTPPSLSSLPNADDREEQSWNRLEYGTLVTLPGVFGGRVSSPQLSRNKTYKFRFDGDYGKESTGDLTVDDNVWFDDKEINEVSMK